MSTADIEARTELQSLASPALDHQISQAEPKDFFALMKPGVMRLVVFTALVGMVSAAATSDTVLLEPVTGAIALLCIAIGGGASGALNMWYEADLDRLMKRTAKRPIPAGRVSRNEALGFGIFMAALSVMILGLVANLLAAALLAFTIFFYIVVYTIWLKRRTQQNIVIGGAAGALPPVVAWAAMTGSVGIEPFVLFLIIFMWTPPHFWALALFASKDYERAGIPMMPVVSGDAYTRRQILIYSILLAPVALAPWVLGFGGLVYGLTTALLSIGFIWRAVVVYRDTEAAENNRAAKRLFAYSIIYLFALFGVLLLEAIVQLVF
uniref:heme o synthase n=1 Tax=Pararhizobium sp. IMCC3301 TaxID=3067904 RepID=UPI0027407A67|nr:heme o synthase [Pararhizobium sp. IMCC3301]